MSNLFLFLGIGGQEFGIILVLALLLFGGKKIPELMRGLGSGIREFNNARANIEGEIKNGIRDAEREPTKKVD
jgi:sec-independent protein translocase protein TatA